MLNQNYSASEVCKSREIIKIESRYKERIEKDYDARARVRYVTARGYARRLKIFKILLKVTTTTSERGLAVRQRLKSMARETREMSQRLTLK